MGIGLLVFGIAAIGSGISCIKDDYVSRKDSAYYDNNGYLTSYDRKGNEYKNGERVVKRSKKDKSGKSHSYLIGVESGKIYEDNYAKEMEYRNKVDQKTLKFCKEHNYKAACLYNEYFGMPVTTELETGKIIACLWERKNLETQESEYRKFYVKSDARPSEYNKTEEGDMGIIISKEEFSSLNCLGTHTRYPSDSDVVYKLIYGKD